MNELQDIKIALSRIEDKIDHLFSLAKARNLKKDSFTKEVILLSVEDVAKMLRVAQRTVYGWVQENRIPYLKINGRLLFDKKDIDELCTKSKSKKVT